MKEEEKQNQKSRETQEKGCAGGQICPERKENMWGTVKKGWIWMLAEKQRKRMLAAALVYLFVLLLVANDAWLYKTPVAKITEVKTKESRNEEDVRGEREPYYAQQIKGILLNGEKKGKTVRLSNEYSYSGVLDQKYQKGDKVLVTLEGDSLKGTIKSLKRDTHLAALSGALMLLLLIVTREKGLLTILTVVANLGIFVLGFTGFLQGREVIAVCNFMTVLFAVVPLVILNGFHKKTWAAVFSTLGVLALIMGMFDLTMQYTGGLDYSSMEYLGSMDDPGELFRAEVMLAGLGAIMDVAVTISSALGEIARKNPSVSVRKLIRSGREIGYDIMGTMMNVLLFVFACSQIPTFLIRMNNDVDFFTILRLHIPYEICCFLVESIGIVLAIPVSIFFGAVFMKTGRIRKDRREDR